MLESEKKKRKKYVWAETGKVTSDAVHCRLLSRYCDPHIVLDVITKKEQSLSWRSPQSQLLRKLL